MCGIFGFSSYAEEAKTDLVALLNELASESSVRGTDACGIAYHHKNRIVIDKAPKAAYAVTFKPPKEVSAIIGHTRHATHGLAKKNYNNHPFYGKAGGTKFALTHNGVLCNMDELQKQYRIPKSKIETDSYIAVQLIEQQKLLDENSLRFMAETVSGSFSFALLDDKSNVYLIKGDNPIAILHFPKEKLFVYASTEEILWKSVINTKLFDTLKLGHYEEIPLEEGQILKITPRGELSYSKFDYDEYAAYGLCRWYDYGWGFSTPTQNQSSKDDYLSMLKQAALMEGYESSEIDALVAEGFSPDEIEDYIYGCYSY